MFFKKLQKNKRPVFFILSAIIFAFLSAIKLSSPQKLQANPGFSTGRSFRTIQDRCPEKSWIQFTDTADSYNPATGTYTLTIKAEKIHPEDLNAAVNFQYLQETCFGTDPNSCGLCTNKQWIDKVIPEGQMSINFDISVQQPEGARDCGCVQIDTYIWRVFGNEECRTVNRNNEPPSDRRYLWGSGHGDICTTPTPTPTPTTEITPTPTPTGEITPTPTSSNPTPTPNNVTPTPTVPGEILSAKTLAFTGTSPITKDQLEAIIYGLISLTSLFQGIRLLKKA